MTLLRTILVFVILVILAHLGIVYFGINENQNDLTSGIVSLGELLEMPARTLIDALPLSPEQRQSVNGGGFYFVAFSAAGLYFVLFLLLGVGRR